MVVCTAPGRDSGRFIPLKKRKMDESLSDPELSFRNNSERSQILTNGLLECIPKKFRYNNEFLHLMNTHLKNVVESTAAAFGNFSQFEKSDSSKNQEIVKTEFIEH